MKRKLQIWGLLTTLVLTGSCIQEELPSLDKMGGLLLTLNEASISSEVEETRAVPQNIEHKLSDFDIRITHQSEKWVAYNGKYTGGRIPVYSGTYDVVASFGQNDNLAFDAPYFWGSTDLTIVTNETVEKSIHCTVANSLVSVLFEGKDRFDRFFSTYELLVELNGQALAINYENKEQSIYFPAGSTPIISFHGTLKADGNREVKQEIVSSELPTTYTAGEHAIITLQVNNNVEDGAMIFVKKVDVEYVDVERVFPVEWLPAPTVTPTHVYADGVLMGTKIDFSNGYSGKNWKAEIYNANNEMVRQVEGTGALSSNINYNEEWPYLPQGTYKARFFVELCGNMKRTRERTFSVSAPTIQMKQGGYTSYTKYIEGDVDGANSCDRNTIYAPQVTLLVEENLTKIAKYHSNLQMTNIDGNTKSTTTGNVLSFDNASGKPARAESYRATASASFDGVETEMNLDYYITGLPLECAPPTKEQGWAENRSENTSWEYAYVRLGGKRDNSNLYITFSDVYIPASTKIAVDYNIMVHPATMGTRFAIISSVNDSGATDHTNIDDLSSSLFDILYDAGKINGGVANTDDININGNTTTTLTKAANYLQCYNSYSSVDGAITIEGMEFAAWHGTSSYIYYVRFTYGK